MAYPTVSAPYGLKPINLIGGQVFAGSTRTLPITTSSVNYNTAMFYGDVVKLDATNGTVILSNLSNQSTPVAGVVGVFLGCFYTNPGTNQRLYAQYWPGFASGVTDAAAIIADDPDTLFQVASVGATANSTGLNVTGLTQAILGANVTLVLNTGNTNTGDSRIGVTTQATASDSAAMRVVDLVADTSVTTGGVIYYNELIVKFNFGYHSYYNATGVA
jgi:hypothetical protein